MLLEQEPPMRFRALVCADSIFAQEKESKKSFDVFIVFFAVEKRISIKFACLFLQGIFNVWKIYGFWL